MIHFWNWFVKLTGWPVQFVCFRTKLHYENKEIQGRMIHGPAIIICNHTSVFDYVVLLFAFWARTLRVQMAELLFRKPFLGTLLKLLGGIYVDRNSMDFSFVDRSAAILEKGGVVGIFPESRIPLKGEARPLPFKDSAALLALTTGMPVIPVFTDGSYFSRVRAHAIIGTPMQAAAFTDPALTDKENLQRVTAGFRERIIELEKLLNEQKKT